MSDEVKPMYIGQSLVTAMDQDSVTGLIKYTVDSGRMFYATVEQAQAMASEIPYDDGLISVKKWKPTITAILQLLLEANLQLNDKSFVLDRVDDSILENHRNALAKLYSVDNAEHISLKQIDDVLKKDAGSETSGESA